MDDAAVWRIAEWLTVTLRLIVDKPNAVVVTPVPQPSGLLLTVTVDQMELGKAMGQMGRTARSIKIVLMAMGMKEGLRVGLDLREG